MDELIVLKNVFVTYAESDRRVKAVEGVDINISRGESLGLIGESGCGKTTLGMAITRLLPANTKLKGSILFDNFDLMQAAGNKLSDVRGKFISYIFQEPSSSLNPVLTCGYQIQEMFMARQGLSPASAKEKSIEIMKQAGIKDALGTFDSYPHQLSGGQKQRILIAMAISLGPRLIIADEPTTALDATIQQGILELLRRLRESLNLSILLITHDLNIARFISDRIAIMYAGRIVEVSKTSDIFEKPLMPYTMGLLKCVPQMDKLSFKLEAIEGDVPDLANLPSGCKFNPRCKYRKQICSDIEPALVDYGAGHMARCHFAGKIEWAR